MRASAQARGMPRLRLFDRSLRRRTILLRRAVELRRRATGILDMQSLGDDDPVFRVLDRGVQLARRAGSQRELARIRIQQARAFTQMERFYLARQCYREAAELQRQLKAYAGLAGTYLDLVSLGSFCSDYGDIRDFTAAAAAVAVQTTDPFAHGCASFAAAIKAGVEWDDVAREAACKQALAFFEAAQDDSYIVTICLSLEQIARHRHREEESLHMAQRALAAAMRLRRGPRQRELEDLLKRNYPGLWAEAGYGTALP